MQDNYTSFKIHSNYYAGILDVIEDLPEAEKNSILAEYFLAFHEYGNTRKIPTFKNKIAQGFFKTHLYSIDKSKADLGFTIQETTRGAVQEAYNWYLDHQYI